MKVDYYESNFGIGPLDPVKDAELIRKMRYRYLVEELEDNMKHEFMRVNKIGPYEEKSDTTA